MNLEVDVMEGDAINQIDGIVSQQRGDKYRIIRWRHKGEWNCGGPFNNEFPLDLPTFTRYCDGCGLTVKEVKPEPAVETIKPPEWVAQCAASGKLRFYTSQDGRDKCVQSAKNWKPVRIDWGAK